MIKTFKHKGLSELFNTGSSRRVGNQYQAKSCRCLDLLDHAKSLDELHVSGYDFHKLKGNPIRYAMKINANYRITFGWKKGVIDVDLEDYH